MQLTIELLWVNVLNGGLDKHFTNGDDNYYLKRRHCTMPSHNISLIMMSSNIIHSKGQCLEFSLYKPEMIY